MMPGLATVASALNRRDLCRASIAAVHLRIPDLPDPFARLAMETEDLLIKVEARADQLLRGDWNPAEHPRAGTSPNPGWFAPTDGGGTEPAANADKDTPLRLPPGERNDEIGDLLEWIANAKPEDAPAISDEINRLFYQKGDFQDGNALHHALASVLANPDQANRQQILTDYEPITHHDPDAAGALMTDLGAGAILGPLLPRARGLAPATETAAGAASEFWKLGWAARGAAIHEAVGANLPFGFKGIDNFASGIATSIKTLDLNAATYQDAGRLTYRLNNYIRKLAEFDGATYGEQTVNASDITSRILNVAVPKGSMTATQKTAIDTAIERAKDAGVILKITPF